MAKLLVKEICKEKGISLKVLAEKLGITPSALSQSLNCPNPSMLSLERIAKALHVNLSELFDREYGMINGFIKVNNDIYSVQTLDQWVQVSRKLDGLVQIPTSDEIDGHRKEVSSFCARSIKNSQSASTMLAIGTIEVFTLSYDAICRRFHLTICKGRGDIWFNQYDVLEYCGESDPQNTDIDLMVSEILNDIEAVFEDSSFGEDL